jgi:uncharacterized protein (DUF58 family)
MLYPRLIEKINKIHIRTNFLVNGTFAGEYKAALKGRGLEFETLRRYQAGDDVRTMDWNVTARAGEPFVREYREERELTVMLLVDRSGSNDFGTRGCCKRELGAEAAAIIAAAAIKSGDRVGLLLFSDVVEKYLPPQRGWSQVWTVLSEILTHKTRHRKTSLSVALEYLMKVQRRRVVCFLLSDFIDKDYEKTLSTAGRRHEVVCMLLSDRAEIEMPPLGMVAFRDAETGKEIYVNTSTKNFERKFNLLSGYCTKEIINKFRSSRLDFVQLKTDGQIVEPLIRYFRRRERHLAHSRPSF